MLAIDGSPRACDGLENAAMRVVLSLSLALELRPRIYGLDASGVASGNNKWGSGVLVGKTVYAARPHTTGLHPLCGKQAPTPL